jgi:hypothetical protein
MGKRSWTRGLWVAWPLAVWGCSQAASPQVEFPDMQEESTGTDVAVSSDVGEPETSEDAAPIDTAPECTLATECATGDACLVPACQNGQCASSARVCDDGNPCTDDGCDPAIGCTAPANTLPCSDSDACTDGDTCQFGACQGIATPCDDGNPCTDDACAPATGCLFVPNAVACSDGDACTADDKCANSKCLGSAIPCDDQLPCTSDSCDPTSGCVHTANDAATCDDGNACTQTDQCQGGKCLGSNAKSCDDGDACTVDQCAPLTGQCSHLGDATPGAQLCGIVDRHNFVRANAKPAPALPLPPLTWNAALAVTAQAWANQCKWQHNPDRSLGHPYYVGENMAASSTMLTVDQVTDMWASEVAFYHYDTNTCDANQMCGHYTQLVWSTTLEVGCGLASCPSIGGLGWGGLVWVCDYGPGGNMVGVKPY